MNRRIRTESTTAFSHWLRQASSMQQAFMFASLALLSSQACAALPAHAAHKVEDRLATLAAKQFQWDQYEVMQLSGTPSYVKSFTSADPAIEAAQALAVHTDIFQRMLTFKNKIVLSGLEPDWHWLAEIEASPDGSRGYVSALYVDAKGANPTTSGADRSFQWLPAGAARRFSLHSSENSNTVIQHVYSIALPPDKIFAYVGRRLRGEGWAQDPTFTAYESGSWRRKNARIMLFPQVNADGTSLFVHYIE